MKNYLKDFKSFGLNEGFGWGSQANESKMYDDGFTGDLDQAEDGVVTLDSLAMDEFGMPYDQLGPGEKEWCNDEYDKLA